MWKQRTKGISGGASGDDAWGGGFDDDGLVDGLALAVEVGQGASG